MSLVEDPSEKDKGPPLARQRTTAGDVGLQTSDPAAPGWRRVRCGRGWRYLGTRGEPLLGQSRARCQALVIPPAWSDVWINPDRQGHIQAAGQDAAGRRQYIYHPRWQAAMAAAKFEDLPRFAERLPRLRATLRRRLRAPSDEADYALAILVSLLDCAGLRIGHRRYRRLSGSVGATTLQTRHLTASPEGLKLSFPGKSGQKQVVLIEDDELAAALSDLRGAPDEDIFRLDSGRISAGDVNHFIGQIMGEGFTSKDFRTWGGSVAATRALCADPFPSVSAVTRAAADWLGNTPAVARRAYIHPAILEAAERGKTPVARGGPAKLRVAEQICFALITAEA